MDVSTAQVLLFDAQIPHVGKPMGDDVLAEPQKKVRSTGSNPGTCEVDGCSNTKGVTWVGRHQKWYCLAHKIRATRNLDMTLPLSRSTGPNRKGARPTKCQYPSCDITSKKWCDLEDHKGYCCSTHYYRAKAGRNMDGKDKHK